MRIIKLLFLGFVVSSSYCMQQVKKEYNSIFDVFYGRENIAKKGFDEAQEDFLKKFSTQISGPIKILSHDIFDQIVAKTILREHPEINFYPKIVKRLYLENGSDASPKFSPNGSLLAFSPKASSAIIFWDLEKHQPIGAPFNGLGEGVWAPQLSPNDKLFALGFANGAIRLWDIAMQQQFTLQGHGAIIPLAFSPDSRLLAAASTDGTIRMWDVITQRQIGNPLQLSRDCIVFSLAFSPNGRLLASGSKDGTIRLWDVRTQQQICDPLQGHRNLVRTFAFSPNGRLLASGADDATIRLWDVKTQQEMGLLQGDKSWIDQVAFSPDGTYLASVDLTGIIRLWDVKTQQLIGQFKVSQRTSIAFRSDGKLLACDENGSIIIWEITLLSAENLKQLTIEQALFLLLLDIKKPNNARKLLWQIDKRLKPKDVYSILMSFDAESRANIIAKYNVIMPKQGPPAAAAAEDAAMVMEMTDLQLPKSSRKRAEDACESHAKRHQS